MTAEQVTAGATVATALIAAAATLGAARRRRRERRPAELVLTTRVEWRPWTSTEEASSAHNFVVITNHGPAPADQVTITWDDGPGRLLYSGEFPVKRLGVGSSIDLHDIRVWGDGGGRELQIKW